MMRAGLEKKPHIPAKMKGKSEKKKERWSCIEMLFFPFSKFIGKYDCHYIKCVDNLMLQDKESALCISPRMFVTFASK